MTGDRITIREGSLDDAGLLLTWFDEAVAWMVARGVVAHQPWEDELQAARSCSRSVALLSPGLPRRGGLCHTFGHERGAGL